MGNPSGVAPACNIQVNPPPTNGLPTALPVVITPNVNSIQSIVEAIIQLRTGLTALTSLPLINNTVDNVPVQLTALGKNVTPHGSGGGGGGGGGGYGNNGNRKNNKQTKAGNGNFVEIKSQRVYKKVTVYNPTDKSQYVKVKQIVRLVFYDKKSKQKITWAQ